MPQRLFSFLAGRSGRLRGQPRPTDGSEEKKPANDCAREAGRGSARVGAGPRWMERERGNKKGGGESESSGRAVGHRGAACRTSWMTSSSNSRSSRVKKSLFRIFSTGEVCSSPCTLQNMVAGRVGWVGLWDGVGASACTLCGSLSLQRGQAQLLARASSFFSPVGRVVSLRSGVPLPGSSSTPPECVPRVPWFPEAGRSSLRSRARFSHTSLASESPRAHSRWRQKKENQKQMNAKTPRYLFLLSLLLKKAKE